MRSHIYYATSSNFIFCSVNESLRGTVHHTFPTMMLHRSRSSGLKLVFANGKEVLEADTIFHGYFGMGLP
ncbi:MAG: hypothetical protein ACQ5SW_02585 [Sphaerochaetaceae bacterium]